MNMTSQSILQSIPSQLMDVIEESKYKKSDKKRKLIECSIQFVNVSSQISTPKDLDSDQIKFLCSILPPMFPRFNPRKLIFYFLVKGPCIIFASLCSAVCSGTMVNYVGKLCLAPMVRSGELPTRLMALKYGADLVWTPEYIDKKIIKTERVINSNINSIDYITEENNNSSNIKNRVVFRTLPLIETGKLIFQLGSSNPDLAVEAAKKVINDVDGIDLNCGCPKPFSTHSGMGAALLQNPKLLCSILLNLVEKIGKPFNKPISCKIRLLPSYSDTYSLISSICDTGISNLTIHCRTKDMRNKDDPVWIFLPKLIPFIQSKGISVILNGNIQCKKDFENLQLALNNNQIGGMIAECAESNPSVFSLNPLTAKKSIAEFLSIAKKYNYDNVPNSKYITLTHIPGKSPFYKKMSQQRTHEDLLKISAQILDSDEDLLNMIVARDLQKSKYFTPDEYNDFINQRKIMMNEMVKNNQNVDIDSHTIISQSELERRALNAKKQEKKQYEPSEKLKKKNEPSTKNHDNQHEQPSTKRPIEDLDSKSKKPKLDLDLSKETVVGI